MQIRLAEQTELLKYILAGGMATLVDWAAFSISSNKLSLTYQLSLGFAYFFGTLAHYILNKFFTFQSRANIISMQLPIYIFTVLLSFFCSLSVLTFFIYFINLDKTILRIITTFIMIFPNYLLHKYLSFNKYLLDNSNC